jgi:hypothetical protein
MLGDLVRNKALDLSKTATAALTVLLMSLLGFILNFFFAHHFFAYPNHEMVIGLRIREVPVEDFLFYITGFLFILLLYFYLSERLANRNDSEDRLINFILYCLLKLIDHKKIFITVLMLVTAGFIVKNMLNPDGMSVPGYFYYLLFVCAPILLLIRTVHLHINWRAFFYTLIITVFISALWEVTLALPRGYWGYNSSVMIGVFIPALNNLPIEAVTVWISSSLVIVVYEFFSLYFQKPVVVLARVLQIFPALMTIPTRILKLDLNRFHR